MKPDIIIIGQNFTDINVAELARKLTRIVPKSALIVLESSLSPDNQTALFIAGIRQIIVAPFHLESLDRDLWYKSVKRVYEWYLPIRGDGELN